ncbi:hypothetical protein LARV_03725 [Longilinea arvoryzae]|uniref:3-keto-disaccharide hydrolase domain-containing protein n=1 Tax=Longilinea arvoryzae TaxID=360412 RepID=A0A0K8MXJ9_9CHLR|nr:hypothetical protein [Longilinea arvoryzae]GAP15930.1 hypothetical protein LARV_03725 [Longilinea arvoryzae]
MKSVYRILAVLAVLSLAALACSLTKGTSDQTSVSTKAPAGPTLLFQDDFSRTGSGWDRSTDESSTTDYIDDTYQIKITETNWYAWANPGKTLGDVHIEVDAWKADGPDGDAAIICRYVDASNFYLLSITTDGYYGIIKYKDGEDTLLGSDSLQGSDLIKTDAGAVNRLRADCVGDHLTLYVNSELLAEVTDADFSSGDIGLASGTYDEGGTDMRFDNLMVYRP